MLKQQILVSSLLALLTHDTSFATPNLSFEDSDQQVSQKRELCDSQDSDAKRIKLKPALVTSMTKQDAIDKIKDAIQQAQNGNAKWEEVMSMQKALCKQFKINRREIGLEPKVDVDFRTIGFLPIEDRFKAILKVPAEFRCNVPKAIRRAILAYELDQIKDPAQKEKLRSALEAELALKVVLFTASQEEARDVTLPKIEGQLAPFKKKYIDIASDIEQLEGELKKLETEKAAREMVLKASKPETKQFQLVLEPDDTEAEDTEISINKLKSEIIKEEIENLQKQLAQLDKIRRVISQQAKPHINKVMRDFKIPRK